MGQCTPCRQAFRVIPTAGCDEWNQTAQLFPPPLEASGSEPHAQGELIHRTPGFEMLLKNSEVQLSDYRGERMLEEWVDNKGVEQTVEPMQKCLGADVNVVDADGDTPLHLAVGGKIENYGQGDSADVEIMCRVQLSNMLISAGAFVDARNSQGRTPLSYGHTEVREGVKMFIKNNRSAVKLKTGRGSVDFSPPVFGGQDNLEEKLKRVGLPCGLCGHPKSDVTLYPCQHKCVCSGCSVAVTCCPLCDEPVKEKINTGPDDEVYDLEKKFNLM
ncbi:hypothetical protein C0Q70_02464 [Pomacea canaliculata]|uniref:RING-type domain-containing protein n=1 Tax=Pomacea canaliculata TaxID=400727 RepID=A0A2T7PQ00_POMCA|nr:hypothetical protein C0Q70_02464 [Pomacea canaliculata]